MKILHTPARFYPHIGGVENYVLTMVRGLVRRNHQVCVISSGDRQDKEPGNCDGICVKKLFPLFKIANTNITPTLPFELMRTDVDIIHTHIPTPWTADWSAFISRIKKVPLIVTYHNDIAGQGIYNSLASVYNRTLLRLVLNQASFIIVTSPKFKSRFLGPYSKKIAVVPNCVDTSVFKPVSKQLIGDIFFLSVLDEYHQYKGLDYLLAAIRRLVHELPDIKLIVGGSGPMREYYTNLSRSLGIADNVSFAGYIPDDRLVDYYNGCRLFVLPSTDPAREGFGIVLLEAMACGRPVVSTNITGVSDDIAGQGAGIVVEPEDSGALGSAIKIILADENLGKQMGMAGRIIVEEKYSSEKVADYLEEIYRNAVQPVETHLKKT